jgi:hypothetical protein
MLGTDKSRGYCLEMISADFLAGAHLDNGDPEILLNSISRYALLQVPAERTPARFFSHKHLRRHHQSNSTEATVPATVSQIV